MAPKRRTRAELLSYIKTNIVVSDDCWIWQGGVISHGYGQVSPGELWNRPGRVRGIAVHIAMWRLLVDDAIPEGSQLHHTCQTRLCCNPDHLELVTQEEHSLRHHPTDACKNGHVGSIVWRGKGRYRRCVICERERNRRRWRSGGAGVKTHGRSGYNQGCKCSVCKQANTDYSRSRSHA